MAQFISVRTEMKDVQDMFGALVKEKEKTQKAILKTIGSNSRTKVRRAYKKNLTIQSGDLYRSIGYKVTKRGNSLRVSANARSAPDYLGRAVYYGSMLTKGYHLEPKAAKILKFQIDGKWISKHSIDIPSHDFVEGPVRQWIGTKDYKEKIDKTLQRELDKLEKKGYTIR